MIVQFDQVTKRFHVGTPDETTLFDHFCFDIEEGEFIAVIGSNGSGKTTMLNLLCGSLPVDGGRILFEGRDITRMKEFHRADFVGRVFQDPQKGSCADLTIMENMALADNKHRSYGLGRAVNKRRIDVYRTMLEECGMGLENRLSTPVGSLSGGQRQALALIIANMTDLRLLILDEHTAALDPKSSETVMHLTDRLVRQKALTTLMVTHNLRFALEYGSRLVMMHEGQCVMDLRDEEKKQIHMEDLLEKFNEISLERGN